MNFRSGYISKFNVVVIGYDVTSRESFQTAESFADDARAIKYYKQVVVAVGNKIDLVDKREVTIEEARSAFAKIGVTKVFETSAKTGEGVKEAIEGAVAYWIESFPNVGEYLSIPEEDYDSVLELEEKEKHSDGEGQNTNKKKWPQEKTKTNAVCNETKQPSPPPQLKQIVPSEAGSHNINSFAMHEFNQTE